MPLQEEPVVGEGGVGPGSQESTSECRDRADGFHDEPDGEELLSSLEEELELAQERIADLERRLAGEAMRTELEKQLVDAGAVDLETAILLAERKLAEGGLTVGEAVGALAQSKGFLFRAPVRPTGASALSGAPVKARDSLEELALEARETGDRRAVLRYLRRRRG